MSENKIVVSEARKIFRAPGPSTYLIDLAIRCMLNVSNWLECMAEGLNVACQKYLTKRKQFYNKKSLRVPSYVFSEDVHSLTIDSIIEIRPRGLAKGERLIFNAMPTEKIFTE